MTVIGICTGTRQPFVINEFVDGECLKELIRRQKTTTDPDDVMSLRHRIKLVRSVFIFIRFYFQLSYTIVTG